MPTCDVSNIGSCNSESSRMHRLSFGATFCATPPLHSDFLMPQEAGRIRLLMRMDYPTMHLFRLSRMERNRILELLLLYYRLHLPSFPALRSLSVLQELYQ